MLPLSSALYSPNFTCTFNGALIFVGIYHHLIFLVPNMLVQNGMGFETHLFEVKV